MPSVDPYSVVSTKKDIAMRRGRPRSFDRQAGVRAALELFRRRGYEGVSVADLTAAIGVAPPSLYAAFGSKAGLFEEALELYVAEGAARRLAVGVGPEAGLEAWTRALLEGGVEALGEHGAACMVSSGMVHCSVEHGAVAALVARRRADALDATVGVLSRWLTPVDARSMARFLMSVMQGLSMQVADGARRPELETVIDIAVEAVGRRAMTVEAK